jgi:NAD(P)-dependent dehydrogenase (short-subunit alcohol dehydrogenase family)
MMAEGLLRQGATVYISARKAEACDAAAAEMAAIGPCHSLPADVSSLTGISRLADAIQAREQRLDILINNAGAAWAAPFDEFPEAGWDKVVNLNMKSPFFLTQALYPLLKAAARPGQPAKVIHVASIDGQTVNPLETYSYAASKAGLIHLTKRMALKLIDDGIVVNAICPGAFPSDMNRAARDDSDTVSARIPAHRIGEPEDMAGAAIYLASRAGDYVVGTTLTVDGGVNLVR